MMLSDWVGDVPEFFAEHWRSRPAIFRPAERFTVPITLSEVDAAIDSGLLRTPYLEMVRKSTPIDEADYTTSRSVNGVVADGYAEAAGVRRLLDEGVTLLLRNVEHWHAATRSLVERLEADLDRRVETFLFVTPPGKQGLPVHRDDADVLLLQINGSKHWRVYGGPPTANWGPGRAGNVGPALLDESVREGEVLYIPRGFAHEAVGEDTLSVHLSFTIQYSKSICTPPASPYTPPPRPSTPNPSPARAASSCSPSSPPPWPLPTPSSSAGPLQPRQKRGSGGSRVLFFARRLMLAT